MIRQGLTLACASSCPPPLKRWATRPVKRWATRHVAESSVPTERRMWRVGLGRSLTVAVRIWRTRPAGGVTVPPPGGHGLEAGVEGSSRLGFGA